MSGPFDRHRSNLLGGINQECLGAFPFARSPVRLFAWATCGRVLSGSGHGVICLGCLGTQLGSSESARWQLKSPAFSERQPTVTWATTSWGGGTLEAGANELRTLNRLVMLSGLHRTPCIMGRRLRSFATTCLRGPGRCKLAGRAC